MLKKENIKVKLECDELKRDIVLYKNTDGHDVAWKRQLVESYEDKFQQDDKEIFKLVEEVRELKMCHRDSVESYRKKSELMKTEMVAINRKIVLENGTLSKKNYNLNQHEKEFVDLQESLSKLLRENKNLRNKLQGQSNSFSLDDKK